MLTGNYFQPGKSGYSEASLESTNNSFTIKIEAGENLVCEKDKVTVSSKLGSLPRKIILPDGGIFETQDDPIISTWFENRTFDQKMYFLERNFGMAIILVACAVLMVFLVYSEGIPRFSKWLAFKFSPEIQVVMGNHVLKFLDETYLEPSTLESTRKAGVQQSFDELLSEISEPVEPVPKLFFRSGGSIVGANALAIPDGTIVITDELIDLAEDNKVAIQGVLAHEIGHIKHRHSLRQAIGLTLIPVFIALISGDIIDVSHIAAGIPIVLVEQGYSREFERESDFYARETLWNMQIDTKPVAELFLKLGVEGDIDAKSEDDSKMTILSTHPGVWERAEFFSETKLQ